MPEAPEVKIMTLSAQQIINQTVTKAEILDGKYLTKFEIPNWQQFLESLPLTVTNVDCKGKLAYITFNNGMSITIGFGMTGKISFTPSEKNHIRLICSSGLTLCFDDYRRFGNWNVYLTQEQLEEKLSHLGIDLLKPLPERDIVIKRFRQHNQWNICKCLTDQNIFSGVGNYIKCESLYRQKIDPIAKVADLTDCQLVELLETCQVFANQSLEMQLDSRLEYRKVSTGFGIELFCVYGRLKDPLGNVVKKIKTPDGRMTSYVPSLQVIGSSDIIIVD